MTNLYISSTHIVSIACLSKVEFDIVLKRITIRIDTYNSNLVVKDDRK